MSRIPLFLALLACASSPKTNSRLHQLVKVSPFRHYRTPSRPIPEPPNGGPVAANPKSNSLLSIIPMNSTLLWLLHALIVVVGVGVGVWILDKFAFFKKGSTIVRWILILVVVFGWTFLVNLFWPVR